MEKVDEELEERLKNWGRWLQDKPAGACSPMLKIMNMNPENIVIDPDEDPVDIQDALLIQKAWRQLPMRPSRYFIARVLVGYWYAYPNTDPIKLILRIHKVKIHRRDVEQLLDLAKKMMRNNICRLEGSFTR